MIENRIGILFNSNMLFRLIRGRAKHESILNYEEAAYHHQVQLVYFRLEDIRINTMQVYAYIRRGTRYERKRITLPNVIHNRAIYMNAASNAKLHKLTTHNICIYNQVNRYGKYKIHQLLTQDPEISPYLPETMLASREHIAAMMQRHSSLILKPDSSSIGRGLMKLDQFPQEWRALYAIRTRRRKKVWRTSLGHGDELPAKVLSLMSNKKYLVQETLPLSTYMGRPFDLRVSVQRIQTGAWQVTGIVGKVAPQHTFVTNVAQGGKVLPFELLAAWSHPNIPYLVLYERIICLSLRIAECLSTELPHMADLGLDIGLSPDGTPLFIECNGRDQRYSFLEAHQTAIWKATYENPIAYGASLLQQQIN